MERIIRFLLSLVYLYMPIQAFFRMRKCMDYGSVSGALIYLMVIFVHTCIYIMRKKIKNTIVIKCNEYELCFQIDPIIVCLEIFIFLDILICKYMIPYMLVSNITETEGIKDVISLMIFVWGGIYCTDVHVLLSGYRRERMKVLRLPFISILAWIVLGINREYYNCELIMVRILTVIFLLEIVFDIYCRKQKSKQKV